MPSSRAWWETDVTCLNEIFTHQIRTMARWLVLSEHMSIADHAQAGVNNSIATETNYYRKIVINHRWRSTPSDDLFVMTTNIRLDGKNTDMRVYFGDARGINAHKTSPTVVALLDRSHCCRRIAWKSLLIILVPRSITRDSSYLCCFSSAFKCSSFRLSCKMSASTRSLDITIQTSDRPVGRKIEWLLARQSPDMNPCSDHLASSVVLAMRNRESRRSGVSASSLEISEHLWSDIDISDVFRCSVGSSCIQWPINYWHA